MLNWKTMGLLLLMLLVAVAGGGGGPIKYGGGGKDWCTIVPSGCCIGITIICGGGYGDRFC